MIDKKTELNKPTPSIANKSFGIISNFFFLVSAIILIFCYLLFFKVKINISPSLVSTFWTLFIVYVGRKEAIRWFCHVSSNRYGELFFYAFALSYLLMEVISSINSGYVTPLVLKRMIIPLLSGFGITETDKAIYTYFKKKESETA